MTTARPRVLAAVLSALLPCLSYAALPEMNLDEPVQTILKDANNSKYELKKEEARHALTLLERLSSFSKNVSKYSEETGKRMRDDQYEDLFNTQLLPLQKQAEGFKETIEKTYGLEKKKVDAGLKAAKGGDYAPITETLARIDKFRTENQPKVDTVFEQVKKIEDVYKHDIGNARNALAQLLQQAPVPDLRNAKPKLIKKVFLEPSSKRPLQWMIVVQKEKKDFNDPRFGQVPTVVSIQDGQETLSYKVVVR